jgi:large subunit ribosomal protein L15
MKLHDLRPAEGSHTARTRVGRGIAAGKGKTAGRGTKGQKARAGGSIPPWFEGGQTPLHMRIPKLRGFRNRGKVEYEVVNVGDIATRAEAGAFAAEGAAAPKKGDPLTVNAEILRAVGLVRDVRKPLKILGGGDLATALFVVADAFTKSATSKIEAAGGTVSVLEVPTETKPALGVADGAATTGKPSGKTRTESPARAARTSRAKTAPETADTEEDRGAAEEDRGAAAEATTTDEPAAAEAPSADHSQDDAAANGPDAEAPTAEVPEAEAPEAAAAEAPEAPDATTAEPEMATDDDSTATEGA